MILIGETVTEELWRSLGQSRETQLKRASGVISRGWGCGGPRIPTDLSNGENLE